MLVENVLVLQIGRINTDDRYINEYTPPPYILRYDTVNETIIYLSLELQ